MATAGRRRSTTEEVRIELEKIFERHPGSHLTDAGETVIPADALVDIFSSLSDGLSDIPLMSGEEIYMFELFLKANPGLQVTPQIILNFIEERTKIHPSRSPFSSDDDVATHEEYRGHSRSSSSESNRAVSHPDSNSRPPSRGPPQTPIKSPLDSQRRQRSTPLAAPSSWSTKRPLPHRRKSDAGSRSDSDQSHGSAFGRSSSRPRMRGPSNPTSPSSSNRDFCGSPPLDATISRPHSRTQSQPQNSFSSPHFEHGYSSPDDNNNYTMRRPRSQFGYNYNDSFESGVPMPHGSNSDSDDEDEIDANLVPDRNSINSTFSLELHDRLDALQRNNEELSRKLLEAEKTLQDKLTNYDMELDEAQHKLEELRIELNASNREEKDLRAKDTKNMSTIATYELELNTVTKSLEQSRATYLSLQKQYQEQCTVSEKYRSDLRLREETIRSLKDAASVHEAEALKWLREREMYEDRIGLLERDLEVLSIAQTHLDEQKQQNLFLKETIDRVRYEMDEMRNAVPGNIAGSGLSSASNTINKSLGAELMGRMKFDMDDDEELEGDTAVEDGDRTEGEEDEEEDVVQTIITKRKRKVASRASIIETRRTFDELKEYSDSGTQYDPTLFAVSHSMQTDPPPKVMKSSFSVQTETPSEPKPLPIPPPRITIEMEIQTEEIEEEPSRSPSPQLNDASSMASSLSTIVPPTPKPQTKALDDHVHSDEPPAYNQITSDRDEQEWRVAAATLKKWHNGAKIPFEPVEGGISKEAVEDWKALKQELGVECMVIDKIIGKSDTIAGSTSRLPREQKVARRGGRFYNIYNTYVYGDNSSSSNNNKFSSGGVFSFGFASQAVVLMGASALVLIAATPYLAPTYSIPGGATYYDRYAWNSFNSMQVAGEGFGPDGTAAVWNFLGRVGGGAARIARGWPT